MDTTRDDSEALINAAEKGAVRLLSILLDEGAKVDARDMWGFTPLMVAAREGHSEIVRLLLNHGADVKATCNAGWDSLVRAAERGDIEILSLLLKAGADVNAKGPDGSTVTSRAANGDHCGVLALLVDAGGDLNFALKWAIKNDRSALVGLIFKTKASTNVDDKTLSIALNYAVEIGNYELVMDLLKLGKINSGDKILSEALTVAINKGHTEIAMLLLDAGADPEAITGTLQKALVGALTGLNGKRLTV